MLSVLSEQLMRAGQSEELSLPAARHFFVLSFRQSQHWELGRVKVSHSSPDYNGISWSDQSYLWSRLSLKLHLHFDIADLRTWCFGVPVIILYVHLPMHCTEHSVLRANSILSKLIIFSIVLPLGLTNCTKLCQCHYFQDLNKKEIFYFLNNLLEMNKWKRAVRMKTLDLLIIFTVFLPFFTSFALQSDSGNLTREANCLRERKYEDGKMVHWLTGREKSQTFRFEQRNLRLVSSRETL